MTLPPWSRSWEPCSSQPRRMLACSRNRAHFWASWLPKLFPRASIASPCLWQWSTTCSHLIKGTSLIRRDLKIPVSITMLSFLTTSLQQEWLWTQPFQMQRFVLMEPPFHLDCSSCRWEIFLAISRAENVKLPMKAYEPVCRMGSHRLERGPCAVVCAQQSHNALKCLGRLQYIFLTIGHW